MKHHPLRTSVLAVLGSSVLAASAFAQPLIETNFESNSLLPWTAHSVSSNADWHVENYNSNHYAYMNGYGADAASDDWLISQAISFDTITNEVLVFKTAKNYDGGSFGAFISTDYTGEGNPNDATWTPLNAAYSEGGYAWVESGNIDLSDITGTGYIGFRYTSTGSGGGEGAIWEIDDILLSGDGELVAVLNPNFSADTSSALTGTPIQFTSDILGGVAPFSYSWDFGDGTTSTDTNPVHTYSSAGSFSVTLTVTDSKGTSKAKTITNALNITQAVDVPLPTKIGDLRIATFNASMNRATQGELHSHLSTGDNAQIESVATIIRYVNPDVILINEFDYNGTANVELFKNYLIKQNESASPVIYAHYYVDTVNTGVPSGMDYNNNGETDNPDDGYGFGAFPGQYGMVILSKFPIKTDAIRTFQNFLWKDMPGAVMPMNPETGESWYNAEETASFRLSSKSHWDIPIEVNGKIVHVLASHPTPPVFDGAEDRNGKRNHDEIRMWADYIVPSKSSYLYDDSGVKGGLALYNRFVIMGDQNADPDEGDSYNNAIMQLLAHPMIDATMTPESLGGQETTGDADDTASWGMRADYVLPSDYGLEVKNSGIFWPESNDVKRSSVDASSDHRLVWVDLAITDETEDSYQDHTPLTRNDDDDDNELPAGDTFGMLLIAIAMLSVSIMTLRRRA